MFKSKNRFWRYKMYFKELSETLKSIDKITKALKEENKALA